jgi:diguanylate cyclase (GGDEF)-like protein
METAHERLAPLACLLVDVDHFKRINDTYGHPYGDFVLVTVAKLLRKLVRRLDAVGRLGGEEFLIVMPNTPQEAAMAVAERIRQVVGDEIFLANEKHVKVTVSIGVVRFPSSELNDKESLFKAVDEALYAAKNNGRNRVITWNSDPAKMA